MNDATLAKYWRAVLTREVLAERIAFVTTAIGLSAGTIYIIGHEVLISHSVPGEAALTLAGWAAWSLLLIISGAYMALTLQMPSIQSLFRNAALRTQYRIDLGLLGLTFICALTPSSLMLVYSPIDWLKPLFVLPSAMIVVSIITSIAFGYRQDAQMTVAALTKLRYLNR